MPYCFIFHKWREASSPYGNERYRVCRRCGLMQHWSGYLGVWVDWGHQKPEGSN